MATSVTTVPDVKLFGRWTFEEVTVRIVTFSLKSSSVWRSKKWLGLYSQIVDISLQDYISVKVDKHATYVPHTAGRYAVKRFRKAQCPIVER